MNAGPTEEPHKFSLMAHLILPQNHSRNPHLYRFQGVFRSQAICRTNYGNSKAQIFWLILRVILLRSRRNQRGWDCGKTSWQAPPICGPFSDGISSISPISQFGLLFITYFLFQCSLLSFLFCLKKWSLISKAQRWIWKAFFHPWCILSKLSIRLIRTPFITLIHVSQVAVLLW